MRRMDRVILVSNRLPVTVRSDGDGNQHLTPSSGGLVTGLTPLHEKSGVWIGYPGDTPNEETLAELKRRRLVPVRIPDAEYDAYYGGYANSALWPLFHYAVDRCHFDPAAYDAYCRVNERFADAVVATAEPGDIVWVHDYHLMLLPQMLRERLPDVTIGFFLHIPFPSAEIFRVLPQRDAILRGLLGADLIGVHTLEHADHATLAIRRLLGIESHRGAVHVDDHIARIEAHPLGIDVDAMRAQAFSPEADVLLAQLRERVGDRRVLLGIDRLDYTKGLPLKLLAFADLLERAPKWREQAALVQLAVPARTEIEEYREQRAEVEQLVGQINGAYGTPGLMPIQYMYRSVDPPELGALYRLADVGLVSPIRDGMNLVAKEYIACQDDTPGVLVVSEFAGAASELGEALRINPWDVPGTSRQIERALEMPEAERRQRMEPLFERVRSNDVHRWVRRFLARLRRQAALRGSAPPVMAAATLAESIGGAFAQARSPLVMLDYSGALREAAAHPEEATPTTEILDLLRDLAAQDGTIAIVSGRTRETLDNWFGTLPITLVAEYGMWMRLPDEDEWRSIGPPIEVSWKRDVRAVLDEYARRGPGSWVEEKSAGLVWHYGEADPVLGRWLALELTANLETMLMTSSADVSYDEHTVEVRQGGVSKGAAYERIVELLGPFDFIMAAGDDRADEDLFGALPNGQFSVKVGGGPSAANAAVRSPRTLRSLLHRMVAERAGAMAERVAAGTPTRMTTA